MPAARIVRCMGKPIENDRLVRFAEKTSREHEEATLAEMAQVVTDGGAEKGDPLRALCVTWDIPYGRFVAWLVEEPERMERYQAALRVRADGLLHAALQVALTPQAGDSVKSGPDGDVTTTEDMLGHRKLVVDTSLKVAAKWDARRFGDSTRVELGVKTARLGEWSELDQSQRIEVARRVAFALAQGAHFAEKKKREPRLLEGVVMRDAPAPPVAISDEDMPV